MDPLASPNSWEKAAQVGIWMPVAQASKERCSVGGQVHKAKSLTQVLKVASTKQRPCYQSAYRFMGYIIAIGKDYYGHFSHCFASVPAGGFFENQIAASFTNSDGKNHRASSPAVHSRQQCFQCKESSDTFTAADKILGPSTQTPPAFDARSWPLTGFERGIPAPEKWMPCFEC